MENKIKVLFIGDIVGRTGRRILAKNWALLRHRYSPNFIFCNGENAAGGLGINSKTADELLGLGIDGITLGNHTWGQREWLKQAFRYRRVCRPANAPKDWPGFDHIFIEKDNIGIIVINLMGQAFIQPVLDNPFQMIEPRINELKEKYQTKNVLIDFYAETTAEKIMMGFFLEDKVTAVLGTHTHVQTADERILGNGTAFISDIGMVGPRDGVLGMDKKTALRRAYNQLPASYNLEKSDMAILNAVLLSIDGRAGQCINIERVYLTDTIYD